MQLIVKKVSKYIKKTKIFRKNQKLNVATAQQCLQDLRNLMIENKVDSEWIIFDIDTDLFTFTTQKINIIAYGADNIADLLYLDITNQKDDLKISDENKQMLDNLSLSLYDEMASGEIHRAEKASESRLGSKLAALFQKKQKAEAKEEETPSSFQKDWTDEEEKQSIDKEDIHTDEKADADSNQQEIAYITVSDEEKRLFEEEPTHEKALATVREVNPIDTQVDEMQLPDKKQLIDFYKHKFLQSNDLTQLIALDKEHLSDLDKKKLNYLLEHESELQTMTENLTNNFVYLILKLENDLRASVEEKRDTLLSQRALDNEISEAIETYETVLKEELEQVIQDEVEHIDSQFQKEKGRLEQDYQQSLKALTQRFENQKEQEKVKLTKVAKQANQAKIETYRQELLNQEKVRRSHELEKFIQEQNVDFYNTLKSEVTKLQATRKQYLDDFIQKMNDLQPTWEKEIAEEKLQTAEKIDAQHQQSIAEMQAMLAELKMVQRDVQQSSDEASERERVRQAFEREMRQKELEWQTTSEKREQLMHTIEQERQNLQKDKEQWQLERLNMIYQQDKPNTGKKWQLIAASILAVGFIGGASVYASNQIIGQQMRQEKNTQLVSQEKMIKRLEKKIAQLEESKEESSVQVTLDDFKYALSTNQPDKIISSFERLNMSQQEQLSSEDIYQVGKAYLIANQLENAKHLSNRPESLNTLIQSYSQLQKKINETHDVNQKKILEETKNDLLGVFNHAKG
ncbi:hypothetical protein CIRMBP1248_00005 [Enterococcus cecorum]|nr:hypothetical protein CIRMBP1248_00005 [Enterococcus cecorum]CAI3255811.1 hypothetical protein CIRMBP1272_00068 [Enterococcus cecorum]CAI3354320.1 hypothetical protein CIRMBP1250_01178 [Enterococcus cecorum]CAI3394603.1 hypothetical protein CIRMBP1254_01269 [Enterococcus cecorum]CAI3487976.1 hypothetical protein CIRMBP1268_02400 [Enterococcus cecorum]